MRILYRVLFLLLLIASLFYVLSNISREIEDGRTQPPIAPFPDKTRYELQLYFGNTQNNNLVVENRVIVTSDQSEEKVIIEELIKGPRNKTLNPSIPPETQLLSIKIVNETCFVNLSNRFLDIYKWKNFNEDIIIWSIVNSLTELNSINAVQILIDGNKEAVFEKSYSLKEPFYRNEQILEKVALTPFVTFNEFLDALKRSNFQNAYELLSKESIIENDFVNFKLMMGSYVHELRDYYIYRYQTQKYSTGVTLVIRYRKKNTSLSGTAVDIIEYWDLVNENTIWKIVLPTNRKIVRL